MGGELRDALEIATARDRLRDAVKIATATPKVGNELRDALEFARRWGILRVGSATP